MTRRDVRKRFSEAVEAGDTAAIARISESDPGIVNAANAHRNVPLGVAIGTVRLDIVRQLVELGADPGHCNHGGHSMLDAAAYGGHEGIARYLIERGAAPSILHHAALGDLAAVKRDWTGQLVQAGGRWRMAPLHAAVRACNLPAVTGLLEFCEPDPKDHNGHTPLALVPELAGAKPRALLATALLDAGASVDAQAGHFSGTVLHRAIVNGQLDLVEVLVARGADLTLQDHAGKTPLHEAVAKGVKYVELLLAGDVDFAIRTRDGETPLGFARRRKKKTIAALLEAAGGP